MKAYKLTDEHGRTRNNTQWGENVTHTVAPELTGELCTGAWIHFYTSPLIAVLMNPCHAYFTDPILWECETAGEHLHEPLKSGCKSLTTIRRIELPKFSANQRTAFGILCAKEMYKDASWNNWADKWLNGSERTYAAATRAASDTYAEAAATYGAALSAYNAAHAAAAAAYAASYIAEAASFAAARAASYIADVASEAAETVGDTAASQSLTIDFHKLAEQALTYS